ncbi:GMC family oxidoreductase [Nocardioides albus]|uniref:Choline dehydrogenase-like flavoprotein n=1 Tax=Nocardioides albus TaxID=1841 RepID=A0A7W5FBK3_9ACTN|nr:GMC family oxidoreductase [Nocardioides albus]MBB3092322.1 choline dehydrogenase-like flavoprotein [Nocardioides albus]GGU47189.1 choline dehydrogenase [Nocardioides albus]
MTHHPTWSSLPDVADVLVVGAGPAGAAIAKGFADAGMSVVCLEQGDWPDYSSARSDQPAFEVAAGKAWSALPNVREGVGDYPIDESESDISALMWNGIGGSVMLYAGQWMRNMPSDFRVRTLDGVADDWPFTYEDLVPYYAKAEHDFAVAGYHGDPAVPDSATYPMLAAPIGEGGRRVARGHNKLGWHWWPGSNAIATRNYGRLKACVQRGTCIWGCVDGAKSTPDITHWPDLIARGVHVVARAAVWKIETNERGLATGAVFFDAQGVERRQRAKVVVLAANGVGTPRILQMSADARHPDGLANSSGLVGKRLMMHPYAAVVGMFDDPIGTTQGIYGQLVYSLEFYETDPSRGFVRGAKWNLMPTGGPIAMMRPFPWGDNSDMWGEPFHRTVKTRLNHSITWGITCEDLPEERNQVLLSDQETDAYGLPAARIVYQTSDNSRRMLDFMSARAQESLIASGASSVSVAPQVRETGWHLLGTTTMGVDPKTSVVNGYGVTHDIPNLVVADGSTWPTSAGMNPTATVVAMALRTAEHLVSGRSHQEVPA